MYRAKQAATAAILGRNLKKHAVERAIASLDRILRVVVGVTCTGACALGGEGCDQARDHHPALGFSCSIAACKASFSRRSLSNSFNKFSTPLTAIIFPHNGAPRLF
jgi:hypothetical protein